ncbi:hypothetical protein C0Q70_03780 [Pomacea canaliculata]|uniref:Uncharacterized protein n=1 Tax=Pomacea canaliculata TaxID=400727 RepID=A0A2T7PTS9_POMCA|nr:hypothetical protein C0Q70_03780 [Pomacea canaliculata]
MKETDPDPEFNLQRTVVVTRRSERNARKKWVYGSRNHTNITAFELRRTPRRPPRQHNARFWDGREASAAREGRWAMESRVTVSARWSARLSAELIRLYLTARFAVIPAFFAYSPQTVPVLFQGQRRGWSVAMAKNHVTVCLHNPRQLRLSSCDFMVQSSV